LFTALPIFVVLVFSLEPFSPKFSDFFEQSIVSAKVPSRFLPEIYPLHSAKSTELLFFSHFFSFFSHISTFTISALVSRATSIEPIMGLSSAFLGPAS
jgi:hypothetical protein